MRVIIILSILLSSSIADARERKPGMVGRIMGWARDIGLVREESDTRKIPDPIMNQIILESIEMANRMAAETLSRAKACMEHYNELKTAPDSLKGARQLMATMYQSCQAPNIVVPNTANMNASPVGGQPRHLRNRNMVSRYLNYNPYLANRASVAPGCFDVLKQPPIYGYGAKPGIRGGSINLHENQATRPHCVTSGVSCRSQPVSGIDCSGFVTGALRRMGLNMFPGEKFIPDNINTAALNTNARRSNSCLRFTEANKDISIVPGDIINIGSNHVIMVEKIGSDPLGLKKHLRNNTCGRLSKNDFDFEFLHSGALAHFGVARVHSSHPEMTGFMESLEVKVRQACNNIKNRNKSVLARSTVSNGLSVFRHAGDSIRGCKGEPEKFANEDCVSGCGYL